MPAQAPFPVIVAASRDGEAAAVARLLKTGGCQSRILSATDADSAFELLEKEGGASKFFFVEGTPRGNPDGVRSTLARRGFCLDDAVFVPADVAATLAAAAKAGACGDCRCC